MSSLAASRADGYYYPPNYDPEKHGSLNQFRGQHPLRERAKKLDQGILVIRFEMPFNVWCAGCNHLIGKGVRFNAEKQQVGSYYSTKVWSFRMRAPCCGQQIEVQTDPKNTEYVVVSGGRRKAETWTAANAETIELPEREEGEAAAAAAADPFARLERGEGDKARGLELGARVAELFHDSNRRFKNDVALNRTLRRDNRAQRRGEQAREGKRKALGLSDDVVLLPEAEEDAAAASLVQFGDRDAFSKKWRQKRRAIRRESIFAPAALTPEGRRNHAAVPAGEDAEGGPHVREPAGEAAGGGAEAKRMRPPPPRPVAKVTASRSAGAVPGQKQGAGRSLADKAAAAAKRQQGGTAMRFQ